MKISVSKCNGDYVGSASCFRSKRSLTGENPKCPHASAKKVERQWFEYFCCVLAAIANKGHDKYCV